jgi:hypothetical protein
MSYSRVRKLIILLVCLAAFNLPWAGAQNAPNKVSFETVDGVKIEGTYYTGSKGTKSAVVLLLHDFDPKTGGKSKTDEWDNLATELQKKGYAVLSFDFRGFGDSTTVNPMTFFRAPQNKGFRGANMTKPPTTISYKEFGSKYYRQLINDVAAARAYVDNENDGSALNSRNVIVIGAGQGATVGMMWMASEFKRHKAQVQQALLPGSPPRLLRLDQDTAGEDLVAGIWLSINPNLGNGGEMPIVRHWASEMGGVKGHKMPMAFIYGGGDPADGLSEKYLKAINPNFQRGKPDKTLEFTGDKEIPKTKLTGSKLLDKDLPTTDFIIKDYLDNLMAKRGITQWKARNNDNEYFYWESVPLPTLAKLKGDKIQIAVPPTVVGFGMP